MKYSGNIFRIFVLIIMVSFILVFIILFKLIYRFEINKLLHRKVSIDSISDLFICYL